MRYAGFWIRFLAWILDGLIIGVPVYVLGGWTYFVMGINSFFSLLQLASIALIIYMEGVYGGTPGKLILGLNVVNDKGAFIGIPSAVLRYISKILSALILGIGYLMIAWDPKKQGLHDRIAETYVLHKS